MATENIVQEITSFIQKHHPKPVLQNNHHIHIPDLNLQFTYCPLLDTPQMNALTLYNKHSLKIWEDQWKFKKPIMQSRLISLIGYSNRIHARKTKALPIPGQEARDFLDKHHILGGTVAKYKYGLRDEQNTLVAVMTFSKGRQIIRDGQAYQSFELIRHCNLSFSTVVGGLSKLLKAFIRDTQPDDIVTYVGQDWSSGKVYKQFGFELIENTPPGWLWVDPHSGKRYSPKRQLNPDWKVAYYPGNNKYLLKLK